MLRTKMEEIFDFDSDGSLDELEIVSLEGGDGPYNVYLDSNTFRTHVDALILRDPKPYSEFKYPNPRGTDRFYQFNTGSKDKKKDKKKDSREELIPFTRFIANLFSIVRLKGPYEVNVRVGEAFKPKIDALIQFARDNSEVLGLMYTINSRTLIYYFVYAKDLKESEEPANPIEKASLVQPERPQTPPPLVERSLTGRAGEPQMISYPSTPERPARRPEDVSLSLTLSPGESLLRRLGESLPEVSRSVSEASEEPDISDRICNSEFFFGPRSERPIHVSYFGTFRRACVRVTRSED